MQIDVRDILAESVGYTRTYKISDERPHLETVRLTKDIEGDVTLSRTEAGLLAQGRLSTEIELECHRCLRTFTRPVAVAFEQRFGQKPRDDELPITARSIELATVAEQEILLSLPIKILDRADCPGIRTEHVKYSK